MSRKIIATARIILNIQLNHWIFVAAAVSVMGLLGMENSYLLLWLGTGIVPLYTYYLRVTAKKIGIFFVEVFAAVVAGCFVPLTILPKIILISMIIVYVALAIRKKMTENPEIVELLSPFVFVTIVAAATIKGHSYAGQTLGLTWVYLVGFFVYYFLTVYLQFVTINEKSASNMPEKELFIQGMKQVGVFSGIAIVLASLTSNTNWLSKLLSKLGDLVIAFLKYIFSGIGEAIHEESVSQTPSVDTGPEEIFGAVEYSELWLKIRDLLEIVYKVFIFVLVVAILYYSIRSMIQFVKQNFTKVGKKPEAIQILSNKDIRESCGKEHEKKEKRSLLGFLSNEQRIRTLYKKRVLHEKEKIIGDRVQQELSYLTAKECCEKIEATELKEMYEKVRYSAEKVTSEDVRRAKG